jgi:hypothetical protein
VLELLAVTSAILWLCIVPERYVSFLAVGRQSLRVTMQRSAYQNGRTSLDSRPSTDHLLAQPRASAWPLGLLRGNEAHVVQKSSSFGELSKEVVR